jgi:geranylgeranyl pyrophosphate synthase
MNYIDFVYKTYKNDIYPFIEGAIPKFPNQKEDHKIFQEILDYCVFEPIASGRRFYPSALFILFYRFLTKKEPQKVHYQIAAAIELFHNSSLCHDDILDNHTIRREKETIAKTSGSNIALLGGNLMIAMMEKLLDEADCTNKESVRREFSRALSYLNYGQYLDENHVWEKVLKEEWSTHWTNIINFKMIVGFLAVRLAAVVADKPSHLDTLDEYEFCMSVISQIINDTGDLYKYYGYYMTTKTLRDSGEEIKQKITYPLVWLVQEKIPFVHKDFCESHDLAGLKQLLEKHNYEAAARHAIAELKAKAMYCIEQIQAPASLYKDIIYDFTAKPDLPIVAVS